MIEIGPDGTPVSGVSGDVYFSKAGGVEETRHVFLGGIGAPDVWLNRETYRIGELGFGTGLNFLVTWRDWKRAVSNGAQLDYVAVEGYPIPIDQLRALLAGLPELAGEVGALLANWPVRVGGVHRMHFEGGRVRLTLLFGEVGEILKAASGHVDAWYLDGFAPARNPSMWTPEVLAEVRRLSAPGARLATFSAAGAVRRSLGDLGFEVVKREGFGRKRDCVAARLPEGPAASRPERVGVIGAGIAGGALVRALSARGIECTLIDKAERPGGGASGNPAALLAPRLPRGRTALGRIMAASYLYAVRFYDGLVAEGAPVWQGVRGGLAMARNDDEAERQARAVAAFGWPDDVMRAVDAVEASALCGVTVEKGGLWFSGAGTLIPPAITAHLARDAAYLQVEIATYERTNEGWNLRDKGGAEIGCFDSVILAAGVGVMALPRGEKWPLRANRGQIAYLPPLVSGPDVPVTYGGYLSPALDLPTGEAGHVLGATYARRDEMPAADWETLRGVDDVHMLELMREYLPALTTSGPIGGRVSLRATIRDYIPLAGRVNDRLYVLGGLGSRGFLTAPLLAELVADQVAGAPLPLEADLVAALNPARFN